MELASAAVAAGMQASSSMGPGQLLADSRTCAQPERLRAGGGGAGGGSSSSDGDGEDEPWKKDEEAISKAATMYRKRAGPAGPGIYDFGSKHVHGQHLTVDASVAVPNLPAKSGVGMQLRPPRLEPNSCIPPREPEPFKPPAPSITDEMQLHDGLRALQPSLLINRVVYDCLQPRPCVPCESARTTSDGDSSAAATLSLPPDRNSAGSRSTGSQAHGDGLLTAPSGTDGIQEILASTPCGVAGAGDRTSAGSSGSSSSAAQQSGRQFDYYPDLPAWYSPQGPGDSTLVFESRFECGNLRRAIQVYNNEYDLIIRPDINTRRHTQWFFFAVSNMRPGVKYQFNIINMQKDDSLYSSGMQPLVSPA